MKLNISKFDHFDRKTTRSGHFFFHQLDVSKYDKLALLMKMTLSHGQTSVERGFSVNKPIPNENMKSESIVSRRLIKDHMLSQKLQPNTINLSNLMLLSVKSARQKYQVYLKQKLNNCFILSICPQGKRFLTVVTLN